MTTTLRRRELLPHRAQLFRQAARAEIEALGWEVVSEDREDGIVIERGSRGIWRPNRKDVLTLLRAEGRS